MHGMVSDLLGFMRKLEDVWHSSEDGPTFRLATIPYIYIEMNGFWLMRLQSIYANPVILFLATPTFHQLRVQQSFREFLEGRHWPVLHGNAPFANPQLSIVATVNTLQQNSSIHQVHVSRLYFWQEGYVVCGRPKISPEI